MYRGFVPTWRKSLDSQVFKDPFLWHLWSYILLKARSESGWINVETGKGETEVWLEPGQMIFGRNKVAKKLKQKPTSTYKRLLKLQKMQNIAIQSDTHYSIITVLNWDIYAEHDKRKEQPKEQARNRQGTGKEQAGDTKNHDEPCMNHDEPCFSTSPPNVGEVPASDQQEKVKEKLMSRYDSEQQRIIENCWECIATTRRSGKISRNIILAELKKWDKFDVKRVAYAIEKYLSGEHYHDGKKENYLYGIMRNTTAKEILANNGERHEKRHGKNPGKFPENKSAAGKYSHLGEVIDG